MNNKNVYSLNNTFEGKIWVDWKGKDGKMGQEISWREKPNISTLRKSPRIGTCVRGILNGTGTRVHSCKRLRPCAVSQISGCDRPQIIHTSMEMAAFSVVCQHEFAFLRALFMSTENIGSDRTSADVPKKTSAIGSAGKTDIGWSLEISTSQQIIHQCLNIWINPALSTNYNQQVNWFSSYYCGFTFTNKHS